MQFYFVLLFYEWNIKFLRCWHLLKSLYDTLCNVKQHQVIYIWLLVVYKLIEMTWQVIAVPTNFMTQVQAIVNWFIGTITAWFPDLILISLVVSLTFAGVYFIKKWVRGSGKGK